MAGYSNITIVGNVGKDPEQKDSKTGPMAKFSVGVSPRKGADTVWFNCTAWGKTADVVMQYVKKGGSVLCSGELQVRAYKDKNGQDRTSVDVNVRDLVLLGRRDEAVEARSEPRSGGKFVPPAPVISDDDLPF